MIGKFGKNGLVGALFIFLLAPILLTILMSFSDDAVIAFPPSRWGFSAYRGLIHNEAFATSFGRSAFIALCVVCVCLITGVLAAYSLVFHDFKGKGVILSLLTAPILLPTIVIGLSLMLVFINLRLVGTFTALIVAHSIIAMPYVVRLALTSFKGIPRDLRDAAMTLGAAPFQSAIKVVLPLIAPALLASSAIVFLISFDEVVISLFLVGPRLVTLPVEVFRYVDLRADPQVAALSTALVLLTFIVVLVLERTVGLARSLK